MLTFPRTGLKCEVTKASFSFDTNVVTHHCTYGTLPDSAGAAADDLFMINDDCEISVDADKRLFYSKIHTAGHVIDAAMTRVGLTFPPTKGYHFPDGSYVEYRGKVEVDKREALVKSLNEEIANLVTEDIPTDIFTMPKGEAEAELNKTQENFDFSVCKDPDVRIVSICNMRCKFSLTLLNPNNSCIYFTLSVHPLSNSALLCFARFSCSQVLAAGRTSRAAKN